MSRLKVNMLPLQAHCFAFGGFEIQMLELINALKRCLDIDVVKMNPWSRETDFDVLHLWGLEQANYNNAFWAKKSGKKVVLTALIGQIATWKDYIRFNISKRIGNVRFLLQVLENIDALVVVNELEAQKAIKYFRIPQEKVFIIPNIITREATEALQTDSKTLSNFKDYFFCAGNISERKNQLLLAKAAVEVGSNIVFAGNFICDHNYKKDFLDLVQKSSNLEYCGSYSNTSPELFRLFKYASGFCLPSYQETQPISVLEAAAFGKNIMIGNGSYSKQRLFRNLLKVNVRSFDSIKAGLSILERNKESQKFTIGKEDLAVCFDLNVANNYLKIYTA